MHNQIEIDIIDECRAEFERLKTHEYRATKKTPRQQVVDVMRQKAREKNNDYQSVWQRLYYLYAKELGGSFFNAKNKMDYIEKNGSMITLLKLAERI